MEHLKELLRKESTFIPSDELLDKLLKLGHIIKVASGTVLTEAGEIDTNLYIVKRGVVRLSDYNGNRDRTFAFGMPGTLFYNKHSFVKDLPSYYQIDLWGDCEIVCISRDDIFKLINENHEAAIWMLRMSMEELFFQEYKNSGVYNGNANERFLALIRQRPELINCVPQKILASYLDISPEYFSRLKKANGILPGKHVNEI